MMILKRAEISRESVKSDSLKSGCKYQKIQTAKGLQSEKINIAIAKFIYKIMTTYKEENNNEH